MRMLAAMVAYCVLLSVAVCADSKVKPKETKPILGRTVVIETNKGTIEMGLYEKDAPITTKNFADLVERKFYDGLKFHRVVPGFVAQGGDPNGNGSGGSDKKIKLEVCSALKHDAAGVVAMARSQHPDSASSQFYITLGPQSFLDMNYAVFGRVTKGLDVVMKLEIGDVMKKVYFKPAVKPKTTSKPAPKK